MAQLSVDQLNKRNSITNIFQALLFIAGAIMVFLSAREMLDLPLWGNRPLTFFFGCWLVFNAIFSYIGKRSQNRFYFFLSTIAGMLLHLGFPEVSVTPLLFVAFIPILAIVEKESKNEGKQAFWTVFRYSYNAFLLWNIMTTFWVANTTFVPSIIAFTLNSLFMTVPIMLYFWARRKLDKRFAFLAFVSFWLAFEFIHLRWEISWPWLTLGNGFASRTMWIQWYEFTGHLGGSLWILLSNFAIFRYIQKVRNKEELKVESLLLPVAVLMVPLFVSIFTYFGYRINGEPINVTVIQPNFEPHYEKFRIPRNQQLERYIRLSKSAITDSTDYLVFPETSFGCYNSATIQSNPEMQELREMLDQYPNTKLISGLCTYDVYDEKIDSLDALREIKRGNDVIYSRMKNAAYEIDNEGVTNQEHIKGKLVPGAEIFPYSKLLFFLEPIVNAAGGSTSGHARGNPTNLDSGKSSVAPTICYESVYGYWIRKFVNQGAELIFIVTNDGWWDNTAGHRQHLAFGVLRAIEFRRSIARSANTGISCFIDQHGRVWQPTSYEEEAAITKTIYARDGKTVYARFGDYIGGIGLLLSCVLFGLFVSIWIKSKK